MCFPYGKEGPMTKRADFLPPQLVKLRLSKRMEAMLCNGSIKRRGPADSEQVPFRYKSVKDGYQPLRARC